MKEAGKQSYRELMIICHVPTMGADGIQFTNFYISRSYTSHQVFVYSRDSPEHPLYLENLSTHVNVVQEIMRINEEL